MNERANESKIVKEALVKSGLSDVSVTHGHGTAWGWLHVKATVAKPSACTCHLAHKEPDGYYQPLCNLCKTLLSTKEHDATELIIKTTGRYRGDYSGNTNVTIRFKE
jgi:hypothetical protein